MRLICLNRSEKTRVEVLQCSLCAASARQQAIVFGIFWIPSSLWDRVLLVFFFGILRSDGIRLAPAVGDSSGVSGRCHDVRRWWKPQWERRQLGAKLRLLSQRGETAANVPQHHRERCGDCKTAKRCKRAGARQNAERQLGFHSITDSNSHRAGGQKAVKDWDFALSFQLYLSSGQCTPDRGRRRRSATVRGSGVQRAAGVRRKTATHYLYFLPQQPTKRGKRCISNTVHEHTRREKPRTMHLLPWDCNCKAQQTQLASLLWTSVQDELQLSPLFLYDRLNLNNFLTCIFNVLLTVFFSIHAPVYHINNTHLWICDYTKYNGKSSLYHTICMHGLIYMLLSCL